MVITAPLDGASGVVKSEVVVDEVAHAAGPAVANARALNSTGINRPRDTRLEDIRRLSATMGECVMGFKAPVRTVSSRAFVLGNERLTKKAVTHRNSPTDESVVIDRISLDQLLEDTVRFDTLL
jgi:hypothetical protein